MTGVDAVAFYSGINPLGRIAAFLAVVVFGALGGSDYLYADDGLTIGFFSVTYLFKLVLDYDVKSFFMLCLLD